MPTRTEGALAPSSARDIALFSVVMLAAVAVRVPALGLGLWRDEGASYYEAVPTSLAVVLERATVSEVSPPAFILLMHYWTRVFGAGELAFKLPAFLCGVLLVPATYLFAARISASRRVGVLAAAIAVFAPDAVYYSQEARPYTLTALVVLLTLYAYCRSVTDPRPARSIAGLAVCAALALYTHYTNLLLLGALGVVTLALWWRGELGDRMGRLVAAGLFAALSFVPWLGIFLTHLSTGTPWIEKAPLAGRARLVLENLLYVVPLPPDLPGGGRVRQLVVFGLMAAGVALVARSWSERRGAASSRPSNAVVAVVTFGLVTVLLAAMSYGRRYMFPFAPIGWTLGAWLAVEAVGSTAKWAARAGAALRVVAVAACLIIVALDVRYALALGGQAKSGLRAFAADLRPEDRAEGFVLVSPDVFASTLAYYTAGQPLSWHGVPTWSEPEFFRPRGYGALWDEPALVAGIAERVREKARGGARRLFLVQQTNGPRDTGTVRMGRAQDVLADLRGRYPLIETRQYDGLLEPVTLYVLRLSE